MEKNTGKLLKRDKTWYILISDLIMEHYRPMQRSEILMYLESAGYKIKNSTLGTILHLGVKDGKFGKLILPSKVSPYYCNPEWVEDFTLKPEYRFNPPWEAFKKIKQ